MPHSTRRQHTYHKVCIIINILAIPLLSNVQIQLRDTARLPAISFLRTGQVDRLLHASLILLIRIMNSRKRLNDRQLTFQIHSLVGLIKCLFCDTREGPCGTDTLQGAGPRTCSRWFNQCSLYRRVFPNGTTAQVVRGCDRDCNKPAMKWILGRYQKTTHCKLCCDSDLCNTHLADPCSRSSTSMASSIILLLCLLATYVRSAV